MGVWGTKNTMRLSEPGMRKAAALAAESVIERGGPLVIGDHPDDYRYFYGGGACIEVCVRVRPNQGTT